jgi:biopolymer transport protein ExbD
MVRRNNRANDASGFNITPMIDMTFLLLIFFMVTSHLTDMDVSIPVGLPEAELGVVPDDRSKRVVLTIDSAGQYYITNDKATKDEMAAYLKKRFENFPPLRIYLRADQETPASKIKEFVAMATEAGAVDVIFGTLKN